LGQNQFDQKAIGVHHQEMFLRMTLSSSWEPSTSLDLEASDQPHDFHPAKNHQWHSLWQEWACLSHYFELKMPGDRMPGDRTPRCTNRPRTLSAAVYPHQIPPKKKPYNVGIGWMNQYLRKNRFFP
jgi:hypothetical protein